MILKWGADLGVRLSNSQPGRRTWEELDLFGLVLGHCVVQLLAIGPSLFIGLVAGETFGAQILALSIVGGLLSSGVGDFLFRKANSITTNLGVNAISYAAPIFALIWLMPFSQFEWHGFDYVVIGALAVVIANLLINFEAEIGWGFRSLVTALWVCGVVAYSRDDIYQFVGIEDWFWLDVGGYYQILALSATVFTLLLAFRVARLVTRTRDEDNRALAIFRDTEELVGRGVLAATVCQNVLTIDASQGADMEGAYEEARTQVAVAVRRAGPSDKERLLALQGQLDMLARSRQQGINFGELCSLVVFASITISLALLTRPPISGVTGFLVEMFVILFGSVVVFLTVNVWDLQRERSSVLLERRPTRWPAWPSHLSDPSGDRTYGGYGVVFSDRGGRVFEQWMSVVVGLVIVCAYIGLMGHKWLGWLSWT